MLRVMTKRRRKIRKRNGAIGVAPPGGYTVEPCRINYITAHPVAEAAIRVFFDPVRKPPEHNGIIKERRARLALHAVLQNLPQGEGSVATRRLDGRAVIKFAAAENDNNDAERGETVYESRSK